MITYDEYKAIVVHLMDSVFEIEKQRCIKMKKLITELNELGKASKLSNPKRFAKILNKLSVLNSIDERYNFK